MILQKFWTDQGVTIEDVGPAYTPAAREHAKYVRETYPGAFPHALRIKNYPGQWVDEIHDRYAIAKQWANVNTDPSAAAAAANGDAIPSLDDKKVKTSRQVSVEARMRTADDAVNNLASSLIRADISADSHKRTVPEARIPDADAIQKVFLRALNSREARRKRARIG